MSHPTAYTLQSLRPGQTLVAADLASWDHLHEVIDTEGPDARFSTEELFVIERSTRVEVIRRTATWAEIRVLEGPSMGRTGFVVPESV